MIADLAFFLYLIGGFAFITWAFLCDDTPRAIERISNTNRLAGFALIFSTGLLWPFWLSYIAGEKSASKD